MEDEFSRVKTSEVRADEDSGSARGSWKREVFEIVDVLAGAAVLVREGVGRADDIVDLDGVL